LLVYRNIVLTLHIAGAAAWLGANLVQLVLTPRFARWGGETAARWADAAGALTRTYYNAAGGILGVTGVLLVMHGGWSWTAGFVLLGIATLVVGGVLGSLEFGPLSARLAAAARGGDEPAVQRLARRTVRSALIDTSLVVLTVFAMVSKWAA
jgi:hypothetical protein